MVTLRLFHVTDPFRPIASRALGPDALEIGRDPAADWPIEDSACELSRRHCSLRLTDAGVSVRDLSANGVFLGPHRRRLAHGVDTVLDPGAELRLGQFIITMDIGLAPANDRSDSEPSAMDAPFDAPLLREPALSAADYLVRDDWSAEHKSSARAHMPDAPLLEAFCEGAGLDPSLFMGEEPATVLRRAGAAYRQTVLGLSDLMSERTSLKSDLEMKRTTVAAANNNPFKWADPHRVAVDLLRSGNDPFLSGEAAINASFQDLKKHVLCLMAGSRAAVAAAFEAVAPKQIEDDAKNQALLFKAEVYWREFQKRHAEIVDEAREKPNGLINRAFKAGYERNLRKLDGLGTVS